MQTALFAATTALGLTLATASARVQTADIPAAVEADYEAHLEALFLDFHRNPELSYAETRTAGIIAAGSAIADCRSCCGGRAS